MKVAILGAGAGGSALAVLCAQRSLDVTVCDRFDELLRRVDDGHVRYTGALGDGMARVRVTRDPVEAAADASLVCVTTTAAGQRWALDAVAKTSAPPDDRAVVVLSGLMGAALCLDRALGSRSLVGETSVFPLSARIVDGRCQIRRVFRPLVATVPGSEGSRLADRLRTVVETVPAHSIIETCLCNPNPLIHAGTMLVNLAYIEREGVNAVAPLEGITPKAARLIDALDAERREIGAAYGYVLSSVDDLYARLSDRRPPFRNPAEAAPQPLQMRFLTEDVPYGLALWLSLGAAADLHLPVMAALMRLYSIVEPELVGESRTLAALGLPARGVGAVLAALNGGVDAHR